MVVIGTLVPYVLVINSIRHIGGPGASIMGMTEPPIAAIAAWIVLGEIFVVVQILGGVIMLIGIIVAQRAREQKAHEPLPEFEEAK
jgi:drug/metabolite transporter (DMT)-like permease